MPKTRLDQALVERGLLPTRAKAQASVIAGAVRVDGARVTKPSANVAEAAIIQLDEPPRYVSRGGEKLEGALVDTGLDVTGADALDLGASTGGFTDCLLQRGAERVIAVDVGYGQLAWSLRNDPRVSVMERTNARYLRPQDIPFRPNIVVCDVAFISIATIWPAVARFAADGFTALMMVKPQFEVGKGQVGSGGVVRDRRLHRDAIMHVAEAIQADRGVITMVAASRLTGPKGNREFFILAKDAATQNVGIDVAAAAKHAAETGQE